MPFSNVKLFLRWSHNIFNSLLCTRESNKKFQEFKATLFVDIELKKYSKKYCLDLGKIDVLEHFLCYMSRKKSCFWIPELPYLPLLIDIVAKYLYCLENFWINTKIVRREIQTKECCCFLLCLCECFLYSMPKAFEMITK